MNDDSLVDELQKLYAITGSITSVMPYDGYAVTASNITGSTQSHYSEHAIKGEMLTASASFNADALEVVGKDEIKRQLALQLASELLSGKYIEFTQMKDRFNFDTIVKARVYVVPDDHVKIIRMRGL